MAFIKKVTENGVDFIQTNSYFGWHGRGNKSIVKEGGGVIVYI